MASSSLAFSWPINSCSRRGRSFNSNELSSSARTALTNRSGSSLCTAISLGVYRVGWREAMCDDESQTRKFPRSPFSPFVVCISQQVFPEGWYMSAGRSPALRSLGQYLPAIGLVLAFAPSIIQAQSQPAILMTSPFDTSLSGTEPHVDSYQPVDFKDERARTESYFADSPASTG